MSLPILTIRSEEDAIELVLSATSARTQLSTSVRNEAHREIQNDPDLQQPGLAGRFTRFVARTVEGFLNRDIEYALADIQSVDYTGGRLVFTYRERHGPSFEDVHIGLHGRNVSVLDAFPPDQAHTRLV